MKEKHPQNFWSIHKPFTEYWTWLLLLFYLQTSLMRISAQKCSPGIHTCISFISEELWKWCRRWNKTKRNTTKKKKQHLLNTFHAEKEWTGSRSHHLLWRSNSGVGGRAGGMLGILTRPVPLPILTVRAGFTSTLWLLHNHTVFLYLKYITCSKIITDSFKQNGTHYQPCICSY